MGKKKKGTTELPWVIGILKAAWIESDNGSADPSVIIGCTDEARGFAHGINTLTGLTFAQELLDGLIAHLEKHRAIVSLSTLRKVQEEGSRNNEA